MTDSSLSESQRLALLAAFRDIPGVTHVTTGTLAAGGSYSHSAENIQLPGVPGDGPSLRKIAIGPDFFQTYGMTPVAGRVFDPNYRSDDSTETERVGGFNIVINRKAAETLGFASPQDAIGKTVGGGRPRTIVGVVENARFFSPRATIDPDPFRRSSDPALPGRQFGPAADAGRQSEHRPYRGAAGPGLLG